jgi:hypothetical protein
VSNNPLENDMNFEYANATDDDLCSWFDAAHQDAYEQYEAEQWEREMRQLRWAEAGGYKAGLARPAY